MENTPKNPITITAETESGPVQVRVELAFYAVAECGMIIDGPFDNVDDAIQAGKEVSR